MVATNPDRLNSVTYNDVLASPNSVKTGFESAVERLSGFRNNPSVANFLGNCGLDELGSRTSIDCRSVGHLLGNLRRMKQRDLASTVAALRRQFRQVYDVCKRMPDSEEEVYLAELIQTMRERQFSDENPNGIPYPVAFCLSVLMESGVFDQMLYLEHIVKQCVTPEEALDCVDYVSRCELSVSSGLVEAFKSAPFLADVASNDAHKYSSLYAKLLQLDGQNSEVWKPFVNVVAERVYGVDRSEKTG